MAKIAGLATQEIPGVQAMGKSTVPGLDSLRAKVPGGTASNPRGIGRGRRASGRGRYRYRRLLRGVYRGNLQRHPRNVIDRIEKMTGLDVVEVNISVKNGLTSSGEGDSQGSRVE